MDLKLPDGRQDRRLPRPPFQIRLATLLNLLIALSALMYMNLHLRKEVIHKGDAGESFEQSEAWGWPFTFYGWGHWGEFPELEAREFYAQMATADALIGLAILAALFLALQFKVGRRARRDSASSETRADG